MIFFHKKGLLVLFTGMCLHTSVHAQSTPRIHAVTDLSHAFSFYTDGRFGTQYLQGQTCVANWGNLYDFDFSGANLLVLLGCDDRSPYTEKDFQTVENFARQGGAVLILGSTGGRSQNQLAERFGAAFAKTTKDRLVSPFQSASVQSQGDAVILSLQKKSTWKPVVTTIRQETVMASRKFGKGTVIVGSRTLAGSHPNASDSINTALWRAVLKTAVKGKKLPADAQLQGSGWGNLGNTLKSASGLSISYTDYLAPYAKAMADISSRCMPVIERRMGVPLSGSMGSNILLLATDGGGFSSGETIALAVWWGGFPDREDSMIEFITHESVHSWVLPFPEIWNEPIATYVGDLVMADMGHSDEALKRIAACIDRARKADPNFDLYDINGKSCKPGVAPLPDHQVNDVHWGKTFWIFEQLRKDCPDFLARYFRAKRKHARPDTIGKYDADNTVAVLSIALERDLFPWFRSIGFDVDRNRADIKF